MCRERPKRNVGMVRQDDIHWPLGPNRQQQRRGMAAGIYCLMRILGWRGVAAPMLRLIILLVCVRHLMLLGPRKLVDGCRGPIMTAVSIVDHHQLSIASSAVSWKRLASASRSVSRVSSALRLGQDVRLAHAAATCRFLSLPMADLFSLRCIVPVPGQGCG